MSELTRDVSLLLCAILLSGAMCGVVAVGVNGPGELYAVAAALGVVLPVSLFVLASLARYGSGAGAIVTFTAIRIGCTSALAGFVAWKFPSLRTLTFFVSVTVVYMAGLFVETWLTWKDHQRQGSQAP